MKYFTLFGIIFAGYLAPMASAQAAHREFYDYAEEEEHWSGPNTGESVEDVDSAKRRFSLLWQLETRRDGFGRSRIAGELKLTKDVVLGLLMSVPIESRTGSSTSANILESNTKGAYFNRYLLGDFDMGLFLGFRIEYEAETRYSSFDDDEYTRHWVHLSPGLGFKTITHNGMTLNLQAGGRSSITGGGIDYSLWLELGVGWSI